MEFLKCDAAGCDHSENVAAITAEMVGKPCPTCGANLLTQGDWDFYSQMFKPAVEAMKALGIVAEAEPESVGAVRFNYHDGEMRVRMRDGQ
ncbi:hypothetical protein [Devosia sp. A369]